MTNFPIIRHLTKPIKIVIGPAAVMTAGVMGAGSTTSLVLAGTYFGYQLLWVVVFTLPVLVIAQDSASRIGILSGNKGMFTIMSEQIHPGLKWFFLPPILVLGYIANMGQAKVMVHAAHTLLGLKHPDEAIIIITTVVLVTGALFSVIYGGYRAIERIMTGVLFIMAITFLVVAGRGFSEPLQVLKGLLPEIPADAGGRQAMNFIAAIAGGAIAITAILSFPYFTAEAGYSQQHIPMAFKKAIISFGVVFGIWSISALVAGGSVLHKLPNALEIQNAAQAGQVLGPALGKGGVILFSLGLFGAAYSTLVTVAQLQTYFILDAFEKNWHFKVQNRRFRWIYAALLLLPGLSSFMWTFPALLAIVAAMVLGILGTPMALLLVIYLVNKKELMGQFKAGFLRNAILVFGFLLSLWIAIRKIEDFLR